jgi:uncharacterized protein
MTSRNGTAVLYYASHPTISLEGQERPALGEALLLSLLVEETTAGLYRCEARFNNWTPMERQPFPFFDRNLVDFGQTLAVTMGPPESAREIFNGRISAIEAQYPQQQSPEVTLLAEDRFQDLRMERRTRTFTDSSDADVVQQIASQHGLTAEVDADGPTYRVLTQLNQSDLAFLRERAAAVDAEVWLAGRVLHFQRRSRRQVDEVRLVYGGNLLEFSVMADLAHQRSSVRVSGWDVSRKEGLVAEAGPGSLGGELDRLRGGSAILDQALASRHERIVTDGPVTQAEAQALAEAHYRRRARRFLSGTGLADGNPALRVGTTVELAELGTPFDGRYQVTEVRHTFDRNHGYRTTFAVERPGIGG